MHPDLTDEEVDAICAGYRQNAAKVRFLRALGVQVARKPNGRPLVSRAHYEAVRGRATGSTTAANDAAGLPAGVHFTRAA
jgi:hypothetical protein